MRPLLTVLALAALSLVPVLPAAALTSPASAATEASDEEGIGIRLVDIPAATQNDPRARSYIVDNLPPGTTIQRRVEVHNHTGESQDVHVYPGAARIDGGTFVAEPATATSALSSWTSVDQSLLHLAPDESAMVVVTVTVPEDAPEGEQYGAVWAELRSAPDAESNIVTATRVGVRMYISVGPGNGPAADFTVSGLEASRTDNGDAQVRAEVRNTGGRAIDVSGSLSLTEGPSGLSAGPFAPERVLTLAPGTSGQVVINMGSELPNGPWQAALHLKSGLLEHDATAQLTFPDAGRSVTVEPDEGIPGWVILAAGAIVVLLLAVLGLAVARRRKRPAPAPVD